ncbi:MAG: YraN family protein [Balneolaceae bacterium]
MSKTTREKGSEAENLAAAYLEAKGWTILDQNYFFEHAEVDIVAYDQQFIVFVEVKARSNTFFGRPEEAITPEKEKNIYKAAEAWIYERKMEGALVRFDVIAIIQKKDAGPDITHFEDAFRA